MSVSAAMSLVAFLAFAWYLPGMAIARLAGPRLGASGPVYLALCAGGGPIVFSVLAVLLGPLGVPPVVIVLLVATAAVILAALAGAGRAWWTVVRSAPAYFAVPLMLGIALSAAPMDESLTADTNAHLAAVRACVEESAVFPVRGFHGDDASAGTDPRFGTLHAFHAAASSLTGADVHEVWRVMRGVGLVILLGGGLALIGEMARRKIAIAVAALALLTTPGGAHYNVLTVSAYPLWFSMGIGWTLVAFVLRAGAERPRWVGGVAAAGLAGLVGMHFFAYMLAGFAIAVACLVAPAKDRVAMLRLLLLAGLASLPIVLLRLLTSYAHENPIHQKIWQCMEWSPGLYSASPVFIAGWLFPWGALALVWGAWRWRSLRDGHAYRWLMFSAIAALAWIGIPWLLTPSMALIGFLPLRLLMAVATPFLLGLLVDRQRWRARPVAVALCIFLLASLAGRITDLGRDQDRGTLDWDAVVQVLDDAQAGRPMVLSDPFSMLALRARAPVDVVAVPDGRSSPRDARAIDRLRDAWRALSPAVDLERSVEVLASYGVTHVLVNGTLPSALASYEYPVHGASTALQLNKFRDNPETFREVWGAGEAVLFEVSADAAEAADDSYLQPCGEPGVAGGDGLDIGDGYRVADARASVNREADGRAELVVSGWLEWTGTGEAPDRQLVVRMDRHPPRGPDWLRPVGKLARKFREAAGQPRERFRWTTAPGAGRCPTWVAHDQGPVPLELRLAIPGGIAPGAYRVTLAARDRSIFEPVEFRDLFVDADSWQGPVISTVRIP